MIDAEKRRMMLGIGAITAGMALIPLAKADDPPFHQKQTGRRRGMVGKRWAMFIDLRKCVGCQACTVSCCMENKPPIGQFRTTVKQYEVTNSDAPPPAVGSPTKMFMLPRLCNHCDEPPCVKVCPVQATYQREDGIVMVDNSRCVACAYCVQACPYDARFINEETLTADKCTFCAHRLEVGLLPACVESCVGGARVIGDIKDPHSEISQLLKQHHQHIHVLKPEQQTQPHVFYLGLEPEFVSRVNGQPAIYEAAGA